MDKKTLLFPIYFTIIILFNLLNVCCINSIDGKMDEKINDIIPYPRESSIIPLGVNSHWLFSHTSYDSLGKIQSSQQDLELAIDRMYGMINDSTLVLIVDSNAHKKYPLLVFEYEWESLKEGLLIAFCDKKVDTNGIYIVGEYIGEKRNIYKTKKLWLQYPSKQGNIWKMYSNDTTDTHAVIYELLDTGAIFSIPSQSPNSASPLNFLECYLYKESKGDTVNYFYYHNQFGSVGFLQYQNNVLRRSYILKEYFSIF